MKMILFENPDGTVSTRGGFGANYLAKFDGDRDAALAFVVANLVPVQNPAATNVRIEDIVLPDREFRSAWELNPGGGITIPIAKARKVARETLTHLVRHEMSFLNSRRVQAEIEDDATLVSQIDARKTTLSLTVVPAIRDGIAAAATLADLRAVRQTYLDGRPQAVKDAL